MPVDLSLFLDYDYLEFLAIIGIHFLIFCHQKKLLAVMLCLFCQKTKNKNQEFSYFFLSNHLVVFFIEETTVSSSSQRRYALNCSTSHSSHSFSEAVQCRGCARTAAATAQWATASPVQFNLVGNASQRVVPHCTLVSDV